GRRCTLPIAEARDARQLYLHPAREAPGPAPLDAPAQKDDRRQGAGTSGRACAARRAERADAFRHLVAAGRGAAAVGAARDPPPARARARPGDRCGSLWRGAEHGDRSDRRRAERSAQGKRLTRAVRRRARLIISAPRRWTTSGTPPTS